MSMYFCNSWPRKTWFPLMLGSIVEAVGIGVLCFALWSDHVATVYGMMALTGAGTGLRFMPGMRQLTLLSFELGSVLTRRVGSLHGVGFFPNHIATVVSLMAVALPFGGTLALTIMTTVFNNTSGIKNSAELQDVSVENARVSRTAVFYRVEGKANFLLDGHCVVIRCHHTFDVPGKPTTSKGQMPWLWTYTVFPAVHSRSCVLG
jgi:hypothetical protein